MKTYDVVIVGGAVVGGTLALSLSKLSKSTLSIAVIEAHSFDPSVQGGFDGRSIALSLGTHDLLKRFGLWSEIKPFATPISHIHVSDRGHAGMTDISAESLLVPALGYVVELADIGNVYQKQIGQSNNIDFYCPESISELVQRQDYVSVTLSSGVEITSKLVVAADGTGSQCCQLLKLERQYLDYGQTAIVANVTTSAPHQGKAFERFTDEGPVALLPMSEGRMSLVWCVKPERVERLCSLNDSDFLSDLQERFGWRLGKFEKVGTRHCYPLGLSVREHTVSHRFAVVGNASQTLHPIAGQGFNLGIRDVATLLEEVIGHEAEIDKGCYSILSRYQERRAPDQQETIRLTSSLVHLFSNSFFTAQFGRNIGLMIADNVPGLKQPLIRRTLGKIPR
ncbi:2-octaprenyl-6-methoxyphenyl hydroxylase [Vibrio viridaestus]|uniref:2-octaprenyl-6-methoxyphenyl hydroxylase n=1 Tax=Vibrio viridaestus TaxID=2487322 RepID=A0A3N9U2N1_9VIBR|nr:2-octaprenyl-6-methoxyphenyl hydroxylase [Vibrio viridaestus]RQW63762.1 2-octaprenyl-6-methoxyphenyl hydroxylase [Vibrio viridaestus]